jgi:hypothetical protein
MEWRMMQEGLGARNWKTAAQDRMDGENLFLFGCSAKEEEEK